MWERNLRFVTALIPNLIIVKKNGTLARLGEFGHSTSISLHSYSYIKTLLLFWTGILIFVNSKGNEEQRGKLRSSRNCGYSSGLREENYFRYELSRVSKYRRFEKAGFQFLNF